jgi:hypothetical protein
MNSLFKHYSLRKDTVSSFFEQYQIIQEKNLCNLDRKRYISEATTGSTWSKSLIEEEAMTILTRSIVCRLQNEMRNNTTYIVEEEQAGTYFRLRRVK